MSLIVEISPIEKTDSIGSLSSSDLNLHDCLTDEADWNDEYWDFNQSCISNFSDVLVRTYKISTKGIKFQAIWAGDNPEVTIEFTIEQLVNALETNQVSTSAKYIVNKRA